MKKITRNDLRGLRSTFPSLTEEEMRRYIGGNSDNYWNGDWFSSNPYLMDFGVSTCSSYGYGNGYGDFDGGYLPDVIIYGGGGYPGGYPGGYYISGWYDSYPSWGNEDNWGWGYGYGYDSDNYNDGDGKYWGSNFANFKGNDCYYRSIAGLAGISSVELSDAYGDHLKKKGLTDEQVNSILAQGISHNNYDDFVAFAKKTYGVNFATMDRGTFASSVERGDRNLRGVGYILTGYDENGIPILHSIIINGTKKDSNGNVVIDYTDSRYPDYQWTFNHIILFDEITK